VENELMQFVVAGIFGQEIEVTLTGRWFVIGVLTVLGGVVGSFINVVVHRLPRKMSLSQPPSHCPACERPIRWRDNVPVFGWIILGGRCRDCRAAISPRYPLVEALVAVVGGLLAWREAVTPLGVPVGSAEVFLLTPENFGFHFWLAYVLITAALIEFDGYVPPSILIRSSLIVGLVALLIWRDLQPPGDLYPTTGLFAGMIGMLTAVVIGAGPWVTWLVNTQKWKLAYATTALGELAVVGTFLGDHAVITIGLESMALCVALQIAARKWPAVGRFGWAGPLALVTLIWMVTWPDFVPLDPQISTEPGIRLMVAGSIMTFLAIALQLAWSPNRHLERL
jgi:prepilin signal peptidase PulO-like enzyme (type II secretory pathway)